MGHKNIFDVNSFADFWSWFELGLVPIFWAEDWELSEVRQNVAMRCMTPAKSLDIYGWETATFQHHAQPEGVGINSDICIDEINWPPRPKDFYANARAGTYLYYNSVVGGVRMRQERTDVETCPNSDTDLKASLHRGLCVPDVGYFLMPELHSALRTDVSLTDKPGGRTVYLKSLETQISVRDQLRKLENDVWLGPYTAKVEVLLTTYNAHLDIFSATYVWVFINRGGHMHKVLEPTSTHLTPYRNPFCYILDVLLMLLCLKISVEEGIQIRSSCKQERGLIAGLKAYIAPANIIDCLSVFYFTLLACFWLYHVGKIGNIQEVLRKADPTVVGSFGSEADREGFYAAVDVWVVSDNNLRMVLAVFPFIIGMRFFNVFSLQPRLGVVTATLQRSFVDIFHFTIVFLSIFLVFVTAAMILFGQELDGFTNFGRAIISTFRIMLGDYDWQELVRVGRQQAAIWFVSFTWLVNLIMLNMLLAIVMDVYTEVKGHISAEAETMWSQVNEIAHRWLDMRQGRQISLAKILEALDKYELESTVDESERLTVADFVKLVPDMPEKQAVRILVSAYEFDEESLVRGGSQSETNTRVHHILTNTRSLHDAMENLAHMNEVMAEMMNANFADLRNNRKLNNGELSQGRELSLSPRSDSANSPRSPAAIEVRSRRQRDDKTIGSI
jgi:hypothetical protein